MCAWGTRWGTVLENRTALRERLKSTAPSVARSARSQLKMRPENDPRAHRWPLDCRFPSSNTVCRPSCGQRRAAQMRASLRIVGASQTGLVPQSGPIHESAVGTHCRELVPICRVGSIQKVPLWQRRALRPHVRVALVGAPDMIAIDLKTA